MSFKSLFVAGLLAATATASPAAPKVEAKRKVAGGRCSFHLDEDKDSSAFTPMKSHKIGIQWKDGNGNEFHKTPQHDVKDEMYKGIEINLPEFDDPIIMTIIDNDGGSPKFQGWEFEYKDQFWTTDEKDYCSKGDVNPASEENGGRHEIDYDCSFDC